MPFNPKIIQTCHSSLVTPINEKDTAESIAVITKNFLISILEIISPKPTCAKA